MSLQGRKQAQQQNAQDASHLFGEAHAQAPCSTVDDALSSRGVASAEFLAKYGSLDNTGFATQLYQNVLHRAPVAAGLAYHVGNLNAGVSRADVLIGFSESAQNQAALIGVIQGGVEYIA